jgi:hypothetical protein
MRGCWYRALAHLSVNRIVSPATTSPVQSVVKLSAAVVGLSGILLALGTKLTCMQRTDQEGSGSLERPWDASKGATLTWTVDDTSDRTSIWLMAMTLKR